MKNLWYGMYHRPYLCQRRQLRLQRRLLRGGLLRAQQTVAVGCWRRLLGPLRRLLAAQKRRDGALQMPACVRQLCSDRAQIRALRERATFAAVNGR